MYKKEPGANWLAIEFTQGTAIKPAAIAGNAIRDDAKIGGMTPAVFNFSGI